MKWLLFLALCFGGCVDDARLRVPGGPTGGAGGAGGVGGEGGFGGGPMGACDNESDLEALEGADSSPRDIARDCGRMFECANAIGITGRYGDCVSDCVEETVDGLSTECSSCYGALERCGLEAFCRPQCQVNTCSTLCLDCLNRADCIEEFEDCQGLPGDGCPDSP